MKAATDSQFKLFPRGKVEIIIACLSGAVNSNMGFLFEANVPEVTE